MAVLTLIKSTVMVTLDIKTLELFNQNICDKIFVSLVVHLEVIYVPACLAMEGGSIEQKKTGSGTSTPASSGLFISWLGALFSSALLCARRAAAAAEALDETMVSPVTV